MAKSDRGLLDEIESAVLTDEPLATILRKCVVLGGRAGSASLRDWATRELRGYPKGTDLPEYRQIGAAIFLDGIAGNTQIRGQRIGVHNLPDFAQESIKESVSLAAGVGELEALVERAEDNSVKLSLPGAAELAVFMNREAGDPYQTVMALYWKVHTASIVGVLDHVRTTLAELIGEMRAGTPEGESVPTGEVADQAVQVAVHGDSNRVTVVHRSNDVQIKTSGRSSTIKGQGSAPERPWWRNLKLLGAAIVGLATIAATVIAWFQRG